MVLLNNSMCCAVWLALAVCPARGCAFLGVRGLCCPHLCTLSGFLVFGWLLTKGPLLCSSGRLLSGVHFLPVMGAGGKGLGWGVKGWRCRGAAPQIQPSGHRQLLSCINKKLLKVIYHININRNFMKETKVRALHPPFPLLCKLNYFHFSYPLCQILKSSFLHSGSW